MCELRVVLMNLKKYLLKKGAKSKESAEMLAKEGLVMVNGRTINDPEIPVGEKDDIKIFSDKLKYPASFWKLKKMQDKKKIIKKGDFVLDIGSNDGGFPVFAKELKAEVNVINVEELEILEDYDIEFKKCNVMKVNPSKMFNTKFDLIINELRLDIMKSFQILEKFLDVLDESGRLLIFLPTQNRDKERVKDIVDKMFENNEFYTEEFFEFDKGIYAYAKKIKPYTEGL